ncbi:MAG: Ig-like domain-containing protein [Verrucomicrobiota bacterium]
MKTNLTISLAAFVIGLAWPTYADEISLASAPPVVVQTQPAAGALGVDPALPEIKVIYSKAMQDGSWSWSTWGEENYPETTGQPHYLGDTRTCVLPVKLQPGKFYAIWLNSDKFKNFKDASGRPAVPYLLTFTTASAALLPAARASEIITQSVLTISQCAEGDPRVTRALADLRAVPESQVVSGLLPYLDASQDTVRRAAIYILWQGGLRDIAPATAGLQKLLTHREDTTRGMAALALGGNKVAASYAALASMTIGDKSAYARRCAAYALGLLGDARAEPVLERASQDSDLNVRNNATAALKMLAANASSPGADLPADKIMARTINKPIADFPVADDLSTPEVPVLPGNVPMRARMPR